MRCGTDVPRIAVTQTGLEFGQSSTNEDALVRAPMDVGAATQWVSASSARSMCHFLRLKTGKTLFLPVIHRRIFCGSQSQSRTENSIAGLANTLRTRAADCA